MNQITTIDGFLAKHADGEGFALSLDEVNIGEAAIEALTDASTVNGSVAPEWQVLGRSALGIVTGIDVKRDDRPAVCENGSVLVPIEMTAHAKLGRKLISSLNKLTGEHEPAQPLRWDRRRIPFGRLLRRGALVQLDEAELEEALEKRLIACGDLTDEDTFSGDVRIENGAINMPLEPWELVPNRDLIDGVNSLHSMVEEGRSARAFAFDCMFGVYRNEHHKIPNFMVGSVLFSPGPFHCEVVRAFTPEGDLPQLTSAAWLDANRSPGLHSEFRPGHRGRQIEVVKADPSANHTWTDTRVEIRVFRPADDAIANSQLEMWDTTLSRRTDNHYFGYGNGV